MTKISSILLASLDKELYGIFIIPHSAKYSQKKSEQYLLTES